MQTMRRVLPIAGVMATMAIMPAGAQAPAKTKVTNQGITDTEIVIGTHQDLSGPIKGWGASVANGMKFAVDEINTSGGIHGRKIKLIVEDSGYDPKKAVLATQKLIEKDKIFANVASLGSPTVLAAQDIVLDAGVLQLFPVTAAEFTFTFDPAKPQERLKFNNVPSYIDSTRAAVKFILGVKKFEKPCVIYQDDEYGKNILDGFTRQLESMKIKAGTEVSFKRGSSDFSAPVAKLKADGCDLVVIGGVIREPIGIMGEAKKLGWTPTFMGTTAVSVLEVPALGKEVVEGLYAPSGFEVPYEDTAKGKVKTWVDTYRAAFNSTPNTQAMLGYNDVMMFAHYAKLAGKDLTGDKMLAALESGAEFRDIFNSPVGKFSKTNHLASTIVSVAKVEKGRWVVVKEGLTF